MTNQQYKAIGFFFAYYGRNLEHIANSQMFKKGITPFKDYSTNKQNGFRGFLAEFRVARNVEKDKTKNLLRLTKSWITNNDPHDVDGFAIRIMKANISHEKIMTSLASKILFLNNPHIILPLDSQVKKSVGQKTNLYSEYLLKVEKVKESEEFSECLVFVDAFASQVEKRFKKQIPRLVQVRENRLLDILLWSKNGRKEESE